MKTSNPDITFKMEAADLMLSVQEFDLAKKYMLEVLELIKETNERKELLPKIYLNLGGIADEQNDIDLSIKYFSLAEGLLMNEKGDSIELLAHCYFNLATQFMKKWDKVAVNFIVLACEIYAMFPFAQKSDLLNARMAKLICYACFKNLVNPDEVIDLWTEIRLTPFKDLSEWHVSNFVVIFFPLKSRIKPLNHMLEELQQWVTEDFFKSLTKRIEELGDLNDTYK